MKKYRSKTIKDFSKSERIICNRCGGSGNGPAKSGRCSRCKGSGKIWVPKNRYYPCIADASGRIRKIVGVATTKDAASDFLKEHYKAEWLRCEAIPQPVNHHYFDGESCYR